MNKNVARIFACRTKGQRFDTIRTKLVLARSKDHCKGYTVTDLARGWHGMCVCIRASVEGVRLAGGFERRAAEVLLCQALCHDHIEKHQQA